MIVSVLINNYNYGRYLKECLDSLLSQTYSNLEIIVYDDGSTDDSLEVIRKFKDKVTLIANPNYGRKPAFNQANAINQAFSVAKGEIICLLDSDDFFDINKVARIVDAFQNNPQAVLVQNSAYIYRDSQITGIHDYSYKGPDYITWYYRKKWTAYFNPTSCLSFRRAYLEQVLPLQEDDLWQVWPDVRLSRIAPFYGPVVALAEPLTYYRRHGNSDSANMNRKAWNALQNQKAHHEYVNSAITNYGSKRGKIQYKSSFPMFKYWVKSIISPFLIHYTNN